MADYISVYPPSHNGTYVKATSDGYESDCFLATDPTQPLTGNASGNAWGAENPTNQRFHIDLGSGKIVTRIYYENFHHEGGNTNTGVQHFTFWGSNSATAFAELTYATDTDWTQITAGEDHFDIHASADSADPKYITVTNSTSYRYYALKCADGYGNEYAIGFRRIELQTDEPNNFASIVESIGFSEALITAREAYEELEEDLSFGDAPRYPESFVDTDSDGMSFADVMTYTVVEPFRIFMSAPLQEFPAFESEAATGMNFNASATFPLFTSASRAGHNAPLQEMPKFDVSAHMTITPAYNTSSRFPLMSGEATMTIGKMVTADAEFPKMTSLSTFIISPVVTSSGIFPLARNTASMSIAGRFVDYVLRYIR